MEGKKSTSRQCIAFGCLSNKRNDEKSFFTLPKDTERRREWLILIGREDLLRREDLKPTSYEVCSSHFEKSSMVIMRKLKNDAIPTRFLHKKQESTPITQSCNKSDGVKSQQTIPATQVLPKVKLQNAMSAFVETETEIPITSDAQTQTTETLFDKPVPRKRALIKDLKECEHERRSVDYELDKIKKEFEPNKSSITSEDPEDEFGITLTKIKKESI